MLRASPTNEVVVYENQAEKFTENSGGLVAFQGPNGEQLKPHQPIVLFCGNNRSGHSGKKHKDLPCRFRPRRPGRTAFSEYSKSLFL